MQQDYTGAVGGRGGMLNPERDRQFMAANFYTTQIANGQLMQDSSVRRLVRKMMQSKNISEAQALDELMNTKQGQMKRDALMGANNAGYVGHTNHLDNSRYAVDVFARGGVTANLFDGGGQLAGVNQMSYGAGNVSAQAANAFLGEMNDYFGDRDQIGNMNKTDFMETAALLNQRGGLGLQADFRKFDMNTDAGVRAAAKSASSSGSYSPDVAARLGKEVNSMKDLEELKKSLEGKGDAGSAKLMEAINGLGEHRGIGFNTQSIKKATDTIKQMGNVMDEMKDLYGELTNSQRMQMIERIAGTQMGGNKQSYLAGQIMAEQRGAASAAGVDTRTFIDNMMRYTHQRSEKAFDHGRRGSVETALSGEINRGIGRHIYNDVAHQARFARSMGMKVNEGDMRNLGEERTRSFMKVHPAQDLALRLQTSGRLRSDADKAKYKEMVRLQREHKFQEADTVAQDLTASVRGKVDALSYNMSSPGMAMAKSEQYRSSIYGLGREAYAADIYSDKLVSDHELKANFKSDDLRFVRKVGMDSKMGFGVKGLRDLVTLSNNVDAAKSPEDRAKAELILKEGITKSTNNMGYSDDDQKRLLGLMTGSSRVESTKGLQYMYDRLHKSTSRVGLAAGDRKHIDDQVYTEYMKATEMGLSNSPDLSAKNFFRLFLTGNKNVGDNDPTLAAFASTRTDKELDAVGAKYVRGVGMNASDQMDMKTYRKIMSVAGGASLHEMHGMSEEGMLNRINKEDGKSLLLKHAKEQGLAGVKGKDGKYFFANVKDSGMKGINEEFRKSVLPKGAVGNLLHGKGAYDKASPDEKKRMDDEVESFLKGGGLEVSDRKTGVDSAIGKKGPKSAGVYSYEGQGHAKFYSGADVKLMKMIQSNDADTRNKAFSIIGSTELGLGGYIEKYQNEAVKANAAIGKGYVGDKIRILSENGSVTSNLQETKELFVEVAKAIKEHQEEMAERERSRADRTEIKGAIFHGTKIYGEVEQAD